VLDVLISEIGEVKEATIASGDTDLAQAALESVRQWKFRPYLVDGQPRAVQTQIKFGFHIKAPPPAVPDGRFAHGAYQNEFFGISYPLSMEWVRETGIVRGLFQSGGVSSSSQVLLAALFVPSKSEGLVADSSFVITATPQPSQGDAKEYLASTAEALGAGKLAKLRGEITPMSFAGLSAYRANLKSSRSAAQYQAIVCTFSKGYALRWDFLAASESALDDAVATVAGISKFAGDVAPPATAAAKSDNLPLDSTTRMLVSSGVTAGLLVKRTDPHYPPDAKSAHIQGTVILRAVIDKAGNVIDLEAISGPRELVAPTVYAVRQWKYTPYRLKGEPIELVTTVEVHFTLG